MDVSHQRVRGGLSRAAIRAAARTVLRSQGVRHAFISVALVDDRVMRRLNARHLGSSASTDVIAFSLPDPSGRVTGDVYVGLAAARRSAARLRIPTGEEVTRLVVHGVLHVLGHDHPDGAARLDSPMWRLQERLVRRVRRREHAR